VNFHPDDFLSLIEAVEQQGGAHLSAETCKPSYFRINQPVKADEPQGPKRNVRVGTTGCRRHAKFLVQLLPDAYIIAHADGEELEDLLHICDFDDRNHPQATMSDGSPALAKVCAVDDAMGLWPRFQDAMQTGESFQEI
jgi:hypothetical protein